MLIAEQVALEVVRRMAPLVRRIRRHDRALCDQLRRAGSSMVLNLAEGSGSDEGNARARYWTAAGSAREVSAALRVAVAWDYVEQGDVDVLERGLDRVRRLLWGLLRQRGLDAAGSRARPGRPSFLHCGPRPPPTVTVHGHGARPRPTVTVHGPRSRSTAHPARKSE